MSTSKNDKRRATVPHHIVHRTPHDLRVSICTGLETGGTSTNLYSHLRFQRSWCICIKSFFPTQRVCRHRHYLSHAHSMPPVQSRHAAAASASDAAEDDLLLMDNRSTVSIVRDVTCASVLPRRDSKSPIRETMRRPSHLSNNRYNIPSLLLETKDEERLKRTVCHPNLHLSVNLHLN